MNFHRRILLRLVWLALIAVATGLIKPGGVQAEATPEYKIKAAGGSVAVIEPKKTGMAMAAEGKKSKSDAAKAVKRSARALALSTQAAESAAPTKAKKGDGAAAASTPESESSAPKKAKKGEGSSAADTQKGDGSAAAKAKKSK